MPHDLRDPDILIEDLERDPYPTYARLRVAGPLAWIDALNMWWATRYDDVRAILLDPERFTTAWTGSLIYDTFGSHMLTTEGALHNRYRRATQHAFMTSNIRQRLEAAIEAAADELIEGFAATGEIELRAAFAGRLPIQVILTVFGLPLTSESRMRSWYDSFERALANFAGDPGVRANARRNVAELDMFLDDAIREAGGSRHPGLLDDLVNADPSERLSDGEIKRNLAIIFFGGISTVEGLILNSLWALFQHPEAMAQLRSGRAKPSAAIDETMRWLSPVQSATRHVTRDTEFAGVHLKAGEVVNCMIAAANRDPELFEEPERFDIHRINAERHLGFATGPHMCLGFRLAKAETRIALERLLLRLPGLALDAQRSRAPEGYEFRQPSALHVRWNVTGRDIVQAGRKASP